ncbi:MAG TPA: hypothetical protein PKD64_03920 [Pirellulaceae bacterium]|nr:hypothetical protein [Pirellulaceae bacterium]HMO91318.1 hypothetical protein [Pirellulaceae bacterium]HMP70137.1 hypothetical protein [Pirellulaceae bacterium]
MDSSKILSEDTGSLETVAVSTTNAKPHGRFRSRWSLLKKARWSQAICDSGLPASIQELLLEVVSDTGLMADEKLEVAEELIAHFQDGLTRGCCAAALLEDFGEPQLVAKLIQKSKQRNRSMKNRLIRAVIWLSLLSVCGLLVAVATFYMGKPQPATDFLSIINRPVAEAKDSDKAWSIYRDLWIKYGFGDGGSFDFRDFYVQEEDSERLVQTSDGPAWQVATEKLASVTELLEGFRVGGLRPSFGVSLHSDITQYSEADFRALFPAHDYQQELAAKEAKLPSPMDDAIMSVLLPHVQIMRGAARLLTVDTRWAIEQGDLERATRNIEAMLGISRQVIEHKFIICALAGVAIQTMAMDLIDESLQTNPHFDSQQVARMQLAVSRNRIEEEISFSGERTMFLDLVQKSYTDNGHGDGRITWAGVKMMWGEVPELAASAEAVEGTGTNLERLLNRVIAPTSIFFLASRKQLTDKANELYDRADQFLHAADGDDELARIEQEVEELSFAYAFLKMVFPPVKQIRQMTIRLRGNTAGTIAGLAVLRFERHHGRLPETLDELAGEFLQQVPLDPLDQQPLRYQRRDDGFVIYSVGVNQVDDGGQAVLVRNDGTLVNDNDAQTMDEDVRQLPAGEYILARKYPGDWILWPRHSASSK